MKFSLRNLFGVITYCGIGFLLLRKPLQNQVFYDSFTWAASWVIYPMFYLLDIQDLLPNGPNPQELSKYMEFPHLGGMFLILWFILCAGATFICNGLIIGFVLELIQNLFFHQKNENQSE